MIETKATHLTHCADCEEEIYICDRCDDYIKEGQEIICDDSIHYHNGCEEDRKE